VRWFTLWFVLVVASGATFALLGRSLWHKGMALARAFGVAADRLATVSDQMSPARPLRVADVAVFDDPTEHRRRRAAAARAVDRDRKARHRA
jgi:hypothetical protein